MKLKGSQILCEVLLEQGADTIFGYPGGTVIDIYEALYEYKDRIRHILTAHEQGASHAADGFARSTGKTGVVLATSGPGATNLVTGIATAFMDSVPMVALTGNVGRSLIGKDAFQEVYIAGVTMPITKHNFVVRDVTKLADTVRKAFEIANAHHEGQKRSSGEPYIIHPVAVAKIVLEYGMDCQSVAAAMLHDTVEDTDMTLEDVKKEFGAEICALVDGLTKLGKVPLDIKDKEEQQAENVRKMLLAMSEDIRVIIINIKRNLT